MDRELSQRLIEPLTRRERQMLALLAEGYSRPEIAAKLVVGLASVKTHLHHLYGKLGVNNKRQALDRAQALGLLNPNAPAAGPVHNLPLQLSRFFGREAELGQLSDRLDENRLVTLTGAGGVGKTRLSLRVAEDALGEFADGVWLVELAPLADPALVPRQVAVALGLPDDPRRPSLDLLTAHLRQRQALLVLDNCEHLAAACAHLAEALLRACPALKILASSRQPLGADGEAVFRVPSLPFPDTDQPLTPERLAEFASACLLIDRARLVVPDYRLAAHNAAAISHICRQLDGIPLALELAAARLKLLSAEQVAARLDDALGLLTTGRASALPRHRTLQATIDWSFGLLTEPERALLLRLTVFAGGWTLEAAVAIGADDGREAGPAVSPSEVVDRLTALVDKSLVIAERRQTEPTRYRLLETVRQFAREKLLETGTSERLSRRHAEYFLHFAETNGPQLWYKERPAWLRRFNAERENLRLALAWSFSSPAGGELGPRLTVALHPFWFLRDFREPSIWFPKALAYCQDKTATAPALAASVLAYSDYWTSPATLAATEQSVALSRSLGLAGREILLEGLGTLVTRTLDAHQDWDQYQALLDEREALIESLGSHTAIDPRFHRAYNAILRAQVEFERGQYERATALIPESMRWFEACAHAVNLIWPYRLLGRIANKTGAHDKAREYFSAGLRLAVEDGDARGGQMLAFLCDTSMLQADWAQALEYCQAFIKGAYEAETPLNVLERLEMAAKILAHAGRCQDAARLSGAAEALTDSFGRNTSTEVRTSIGGEDWTTRYADVSLDALVPDWRTRPDGAAIVQAWQDGRALSYDDVVAYALKLSLADPDGGP